MLASVVVAWCGCAKLLKMSDKLVYKKEIDNIIKSLT